MAIVLRLYCLILDQEALAEAMLKQCPALPGDFFQWLHVPVSLLNHLRFFALRNLQCRDLWPAKIHNLELLGYLHQQYFS